MEHFLQSLHTPLTSIVVALSFGIFTLLVCRKLSIVPIGPLLLVGIITGPHFLSIVNPVNLGELLEIIISLGVAIILFEGSLALDYSGYRKAGGVIFKLLSFGVFITLTLNALAIYYLFNFSFTFSLFCSSLIVVTGPTVISPMLRRINVSRKLYNILHWEGVLIDPIGVLISILCFQIVTSEGGLSQALAHLAVQLFAGVGIGAVLGYLAVSALNARLIPEEQVNVFILTMAITTFGLCNIVAEEAGILGVVVSGMTIGIFKKINIEDIKKFKLELTELFLGFLFIVLSANIDLSKMNKFGNEGILLLVYILFITRPASIFICSLGSKLKLKEKLFLSWVSPRGIIAASIATIFSLSLRENPKFADEAWFVEAFTFGVILVTVVLQGFSSGFIARNLRISATGESWVIVGAHDLTEKICHYLMTAGIEVTVIDNNETRVKALQLKNIEAIHSNSLSHELFTRESFFNTSHVLALTDNEQLNKLICNHWLKVVASEHLYRWNVKEKEVQQERKNGIPIWQEMHKPMVVSLEIAKHVLNVRTIDTKDKERPLQTLKPWQMPLMNVRNGKAMPVQNSLELEEADSILVLEKQHTNALPSLLPSRYHFFKDEPQDLVFKSLAESTVGLDSIELREEQKKNIIEKQSNNNICIGNGVAILSLPVAGLSNIYTVLALHSSGIPLASYDSIDIKIIFLIVYPYSKRSTYFAVLTQISKFVLAEKNRQNIIKLTNKNDVAKYITAWEKQNNTPGNKV